MFEKLDDPSESTGPDVVWKNVLYPSCYNHSIELLSSDDNDCVDEIFNEILIYEEIGKRGKDE